MRTQIEIEPALKSRCDLIEIVNSAADFLASRDRDAEDGLEAVWKLHSDPSGKPIIGLKLRSDEHSSDRHFAPEQLSVPNIRELRVLRVWDNVLRDRMTKQILRTDALIAAMED